MSMTNAPEQPKRRRFQFSLLTLIVAVNVAGVLVWANVHLKDFSADIDSIEMIYHVQSQGWPLAARMIQDHTFSHWLWHNCALNALIALSFLTNAGLLTEFLVRRVRKAKRHDG